MKPKITLLTSALPTPHYTFYYTSLNMRTCPQGQNYPEIRYFLKQKKFIKSRGIYCQDL